MHRRDKQRRGVSRMPPGPVSRLAPVWGFTSMIEVDPLGFEPRTSWLQTRRSAVGATGPSHLALSVGYLRLGAHTPDSPYRVRTGRGAESNRNETCWPHRIRTCNRLLNRELLCRLSYWPLEHVVFHGHIQAVLGSPQAPFPRAWWRRQDSNLRPLGYEPSELPSCSTPRQSEFRPPLTAFPATRRSTSVPPLGFEPRTHRLRGGCSAY